MIATAAALGAQEASQPGQYQGRSNPPPDDMIITSNPPQPKPPAGQPAYAQPVAPIRTPPEQQPSSVDPSLNPQLPDDSDIVHVASGQPVQPGQPDLAVRPAGFDPDGDIVHPRPLQPGELAEGTTIRVKLLQRLSTVNTQQGEAFRTQVATDVLQDGQVLIPAGSEIDGKVVKVSSGHPGGHGSMRLRPDAVILPNGTRYQLDAETTGTPGSKTHVAGESTIVPDSRIRRDGIEYGGAVGAGAVTGAIVGGPAGALTGSLIGAGVITAHLLISHPQATLETGTTLLFTLTEPLNLVQAGTSGN